MEPTALFLSRIQFAFTVGYHILFPAFTVGLAAWLSLLEIMSQTTGNPVYRRLFDLWLRVFGLAFGMGVVTGIVLAFEFGTNWSELSLRTGAIQGPLLAYESFTAFALEASFFGVVIFGRDKVPPLFFLFACLMVTLGTTLSSFWIMVNNSWMQLPSGFDVGAGGVFRPTDWSAIIFSPAVQVRFPHMVLAAYVTTAFCVASTGAWYLLRTKSPSEGRAMMAMGLGLAAILVPVQLFVGHLAGDLVHDLQPAKFAAIEGRWENEKPASEILLAIPDEAGERNLFAVAIPYLGSLIGSESLDSEEIGIKSFPPDLRPPMLIPFFAFRIMVGCGLLMLGLSWLGVLLFVRGRLYDARWILWPVACSFPLGFVATLTGWFTAEVGRQPWAVYGLLKTADAVTPSLTALQVATSLVVFGALYALIFGAGMTYIYRTLRAGPAAASDMPVSVNPKRPLAVAAANRS